MTFSVQKKDSERLWIQHFSSGSWYYISNKMIKNDLENIAYLWQLTIFHPLLDSDLCIVAIQPPTTSGSTTLLRWTSADVQGRNPRPSVYIYIQQKYEETHDGLLTELVKGFLFFAETISLLREFKFWNEKIISIASN